MSGTINTLAMELAETIGGTVDFIPEFERREIIEKKIIVVPQGIERAQLARAVVQTDYIFSIGVLKRIASEDELPGMIEEVQTLGRSILGSYSIHGGRCIAVDYEPLYAVELLRERRQFTAVLKVTFRMVQ